jgi:hypothetical protein
LKANALILFGMRAFAWVPVKFYLIGSECAVYSPEDASTHDDGFTGTLCVCEVEDSFCLKQNSTGKILTPP